MHGLMPASLYLASVELNPDARTRTHLYMLYVRRSDCCFHKDVDPMVSLCKEIWLGLWSAWSEGENNIPKLNKRGNDILKK